MMGGLGRSIDGSYAQYTVVDAANAIPFDTDLGWDILGALPETLQTAHGSITAALALQAGESVLIRGGTSTVGLTAISIAHQLGATVLATTRDAAKFELLTQVGADHALLDDATDLPADAIGRYLRAIEAGSLRIVIAATYEGLDKVADAQHDLESGDRPGKRVVVFDGG